MPTSPENYEKFRKQVNALETEIQHQMITSWIPPMCPECQGILSHYCMTRNKLICLKCNNVYEMQPKGKDE
jgi:acetyl-CoA carboxylase beta subunit